MWYRVFAATDACPEPAALLEHLHGLGLAVRAHFRGDDLGWFQAAVTLESEETTLELNRYLTGEDDIRRDLNTWAAWLETQEGNPHQLALMQHVIAAAQLFTLEAPQDPGDSDLVDRLGAGLSRYLAGQTAGVYQVDGRGFFAADGTLLVPE